MNSIFSCFQMFRPAARGAMVTALVLLGFVIFSANLFTPVHAQAGADAAAEFKRISQNLLAARLAGSPLGAGGSPGPFLTREGGRSEERIALETQGAISQRRAKINVPIAATKRALARLGCDDRAFERTWVGTA